MNRRRKAEKSTGAAKATGAQRLTVTLGEDQRRKIEAIANEARTSVATIIRQAVDRYLADVSTQTPKTKGAQRRSI
ncbi:MAG: ribbon-helix-helix protein, CopG family [Rhodopirellula sp.]|nr:ribbon-helix-helix protein, CopG family [Rhodopirellula sp.]